MEENATGGNLEPTGREARLLAALRSNPQLLGHVEELALMVLDEQDLLRDGHDAESKVARLCRGIGGAGLQGWAEAANEGCDSRESGCLPKGQRRHGKKNSTG